MSDQECFVSCDDRSLDQESPADGSQPPMRIGIYDAYLATLGGGENLLAVFTETLERELPTARIELLTHGRGVSLARLTERFGVDLERTSIRAIPTKNRDHLRILGPLRRFLHEQDIARASAPYDLFVNNTVFSLAPSQARRAVYMCMFPLDPEPAAIRDGGPLRRWICSPYVGLRRAIFRRFLSSYDVLLGISKFTQKWIDSMWGVESRLLYPPVETLRTEDEPTKQKKILAVGRFFPGSHNKKHDVLIDAFVHLRNHGLADWELHLAGGVTRVAGTEKYIAALERKAAGHPVHFHFDVPRVQLHQLFGEAAVFWHATGFGEDDDHDPYKLEHFGMSTVEAMSHGCVPIVYASGGQPEVLEEGRSGFLWRDLQTLHDRTLKVSRDENLRRTLAEGAKAHSQRFSRDAFRHEVAKLLAEILPPEVRRPSPSNSQGPGA